MFCRFLSNVKLNLVYGSWLNVMKNAFWPTVLSVAPMVHCCLSVCRLSVVFDVLYCGKTVHPSEKMSEVVKKLIFFGSPPYFYFRFRLYGYRDGRICHIFARTAQQSVLDVKIDLLVLWNLGRPSKNPAYRIFQTEYSGCLDISAHA